MTRKSKPWAVITVASSGPVRTEHGSQAKAYERAIADRDAILAGTSDVYKIRVDWWDPAQNRWVHYEDVHPN